MRTIASLIIAAVVAGAGLLAAGAPAAACEPVYTGTGPDGEPIYLGCELPYDDGGDTDPGYGFQPGAGVVLGW